MAGEKVGVGGAVVGWGWGGVGAGASHTGSWDFVYFSE